MRYPGKELDGAPLPDGADGDVECGFWSLAGVPPLCADAGDAAWGFWLEDCVPA